jgi:hypothetical protein
VNANDGDGIFSKIFGWLPGWVGFLFALAVGVLAIVFGAINSSVGLIAFGVAAIISVILAWISGGRATPRLDPFKHSFGAFIDRLDSPTTVIIIILFVIAIVIAILTRP